MLLKLTISALVLAGTCIATDGHFEDFDVNGNHTELLAILGPYGGNGGNAFSDAGWWTRAISGVDVAWGNTRLRRIRFLYDGSGAQPPAHGGSGGTTGHFNVLAGETITAVNVRYRTRVKAIQFITSTGRTSPYYGQQGGNSAHVPLTGGLKYVSGRSNNRVNNLSFHT